METIKTIKLSLEYDKQSKCKMWFVQSRYFIELFNTDKIMTPFSEHSSFEQVKKQLEFTNPGTEII